MVPARCSCMVLVWAASPSRLSAYSFVIGITVVACKKNFKHFFAWVLLLSSLKVMYLKWNYSFLFNFANRVIVATASHIFWRHWECATSLDMTIQNQSCTPRNPPCHLEPCFSICLPLMFLPHRLHSTLTLLQLMPCNDHDLWEILGTLHCCSE